MQVPADTDSRKGTQSWFNKAGQSEQAGIRVGRGVFGARMQLALVDDGPVTVALDS